jgi:hypothetical protein
MSFFCPHLPLSEVSRLRFKSDEVLDNHKTFGEVAEPGQKQEEQ